MTLKKMLLLAASVAALVAFAAPAAASAAQWYTTTLPTDTLVGPRANQEEVHLEGRLTATQGVAELTCGVTAVVDLWNEGGSAVGEVTEVNLLTAGPECHGVFHVGVNVTCTIVGGGATGEGISTAGSEVAVEGAGFRDVFAPGCGVGLTEAGAEGTLTGTFNNTTSCIDFAESGDLENIEGPVTVDGELCQTPGGNRITLH